MFVLLLYWAQAYPPFPYVFYVLMMMMTLCFLNTMTLWALIPISWAGRARMMIRAHWTLFSFWYAFFFSCTPCTSYERLNSFYDIFRLFIFWGLRAHDLLPTLRYFETIIILLAYLRCLLYEAAFVKNPFLQIHMFFKVSRS